MNAQTKLAIASLLEDPDAPSSSPVLIQNETRDYKELIIAGGVIVKLSPEDFERIRQHNWYVNAKGYAQNREGVKMHRLVLDLVNNLSSMEIHHKNEDKLDNRRSNLILLTHSEHRTTRGKQSNNKSGYKGVSWKKSHSRWVAQIKHEGVVRYIGLFDSAEDAAKAYDQRAKQLFGELANLNFK